MNRRDFSTRVSLSGLGLTGLAGTGAAGGLLASLAGNAVAQGAPVEGQQFSKVEPPVPVTAPGKIEVVEFFSYACPHCNAFEPTLEAWAAKPPADVAFSRVPVPFLMNYENFMRIYYSLETLGKVADVQRKVFTAIHVDHNYLEKPADITALMVKNGIDAAKWDSVFTSFSVATEVARGKKMLAAYKIDSVPTVAVQGRYLTSPAQAGGFPQTIAVTDFLIQRSRVKT